MAVTTEQLEQLPLRAIVAFAARCARRARPLYKVPAHYEPGTGFEAAVEAATRIAEAFARDDDGDPSTFAGVAAAAAHAADFVMVGGPAVVAADAAAKAAAAAAAAVKTTYSVASVRKTVATQAAAASHSSSIAAAAAEAAAEADFQEITKLYLGEHDTLGFPIDPSESGPLGPLWPNGIPGEITEAMQSRTEAQGIAVGSDDAELVIEIEAPEDATDEELIALAGEAVHLADSYYRGIGGNGLKVERLEILEGAMVPAVTPNG